MYLLSDEWIFITCLPSRHLPYLFCFHFFVFVLNPLVKTLSEQLYYNFHNKFLHQVPFLHHAIIITAFVDDSNHSETDFYALNKFKHLPLSPMESALCQSARQAGVPWLKCYSSKILPRLATVMAITFQSLCVYGIQPASLTDLRHSS